MNFSRRFILIRDIMSFENDNGSNESLLSSEQEGKDIEWTTPLKKRSSWRSHVWVGLNILLFIVSVSLFTAPYLGISLESEMDLMRKTSFYCKSEPFPPLLGP